MPLERFFFCKALVSDIKFWGVRECRDLIHIYWQVCDNIYQHIDVLEQGKANSFSLGQSLLIGGEEYEDLDEIIARWVQGTVLQDVLFFLKIM